MLTKLVSERLHYYKYFLPTNISNVPSFDFKSILYIGTFYTDREKAREKALFFNI